MSGEQGAGGREQGAGGRGESNFVIDYLTNQRIDRNQPWGLICQI